MCSAQLAVLEQKGKNHYNRCSHSMEQSGMREYYIIPKRIVVAWSADAPWRRQTTVDSILQRSLTVSLMEVFHSRRAGELAAVAAGKAGVPEGYTQG